MKNSENSSQYKVFGALTLCACVRACVCTCVCVRMYVCASSNAQQKISSYVYLPNGGCFFFFKLHSIHICCQLFQVSKRQSNQLRSSAVHQQQYAEIERLYETSRKNSFILLHKPLVLLNCGFNRLHVSDQLCHNVQ